MHTEYEELFSLMENIGKGLEKLTELAQQKNTAAINDDVNALNEIINHEQAESLAFRGYERKRTDLLKKLGLNGTSLSQLPEHCPAELRDKAEQCTKKLQDQYKVYRGCSDVARKRMEKNLREIDQVIASMGQPDVKEGPGYKPKETELPSNMKTDFHA